MPTTKFAILLLLTASLAACTYLDLDTSISHLPDGPRGLVLAGPNRPEWEAALREIPPAQRPALDYLLYNMPLHDLRELKKDFLLENISLAYAARDRAPWGKDIPDEIFFSALLPYASVNERRNPWRKDFAARFAPVVADCKTPGEAALALNAAIFKSLHVEYNATKRPKPDQSPAESIAAGYASCTGLCVILIDACRSVGVPARIVGTPLWTVPKGDANGNNAGNHMWAEIWDGQWHLLGASEVSKLDDTWFLDNASRAVDGKDELIEGIFAHRIFAANFRQGPASTWFPLVWNLDIKDVSAEDVTLAYANRTPVTLTLSGVSQAHLELRQSGRLVADLTVRGTASLILSGGQTYDATLDANGKITRQVLQIPNEKISTLTLHIP